jgi:hypothetical protein
MSIEQGLYRLKITSEVVVAGIIKKVGEVVELAEREARDLLRREKAVPHADPEAQPEQEPEPAPEQTAAPASRGRSGK